MATYFSAVLQKSAPHRDKLISYLLAPRPIRVEAPRSRGCIALSLVLLVCLGCSAPISEHKSLAQQVQATKADKPRNIILVIGDGMGPQQMALAELYYRRTGDKRAEALHQFIASSTHGTHMPIPASSLVNDSACSATQIAGGCACEPRQIGIDSRGRRCESLARDAQSRNMKVGLVSDTRITHATPAAFIAAVPDRDMEHQIAEQLLASKVDLLLSGGEAFFVSNAAQCKSSRCKDASWVRSYRRDGRDLLQEAQQAGIQLVTNKVELANSRQTPLLGLFSPSHMSDAFGEGLYEEPTLVEMTRRALELLDNPSGFFLMVEVGQINMAAHVNDAGWVLQEMLRLSRVLEGINQFASHRADTLVVVTADHETGGMGLSYKEQDSSGVDTQQGESLDFLSTKTFKALAEQRGSFYRALSESVSKHKAGLNNETLRGEFLQRTGVKLSDTVLNPVQAQLDAASAGKVQDMCGFDPTFYPYHAYRASSLVGRMVGREWGVAWGTGTHTTTPVAVMAQGVGQERFAGWYEATGLGMRLRALLEDAPIASR